MSANPEYQMPGFEDPELQGPGFEDGELTAAVAEWNNQEELLREASVRRAGLCEAVLVVRGEGSGDFAF